MRKITLCLRGWFVTTSAVVFFALLTAVTSRALKFSQDKAFDRNLANKVINFLIQPEELAIYFHISIFCIVISTAIWIYVYSLSRKY